MRIRSDFLAVALFVSFLSGCSSSSPTYLDTVFPEKIGQFNRAKATRNDSSWYVSEYSKPGAVIFYGFGPERTIEDAQKKVKSKQFCQTQISTSPDDFKILREEVLKDRTGQEIGNILICREAVKDTYKNIVKGYKFKITLANDKNYLLLDATTGGVADLIEFAQALPLNSPVDFTPLKLDELIAENPLAGSLPEDLLKLNPPVKLAKEPYLKGKILIIEKIFSQYSGIDPTPSFVKNPETYGLTKEMMTESINQAGTVIQIVCQKGKKIGDYVTKDAEKKRFPAFASDCTVSVIDQTIPAIIARKNFVGNSLLFEEETFTLSKTEVIAPTPTEIDDFIKKLPKK
jgi:hypothetical protein